MSALFSNNSNAKKILLYVHLQSLRRLNVTSKALLGNSVPGEATAVMIGGAVAVVAVAGNNNPMHACTSALVAAPTTRNCNPSNRGNGEDPQHPNGKKDDAVVVTALAPTQMQKVLVA